MEAEIESEKERELHVTENSALANYINQLEREKLNLQEEVRLDKERKDELEKQTRKASKEKNPCSYSHPLIHPLAAKIRGREGGGEGKGSRVLQGRGDQELGGRAAEGERQGHENGGREDQGRTTEPRP